jgi:hypothetical protein
MPTTYGDGSFITGSAEGTINGYAYVFDKIEHEKPVGQADASNADGTPKGGAYVKLKEKVSVTIKAITGTPAPAQMVPFAMAFHGETSRNWLVTNIKISSSNEGAQIRTYNADLVEHVNSI